MPTSTINFNPITVSQAQHIQVTSVAGGASVNEGDDVLTSAAYQFVGQGSGTTANTPILEFILSPAQPTPVNAVIKSFQLNYQVSPISVDDSTFNVFIGLFNPTLGGAYISDSNFNLSFDTSDNPNPVPIFIPVSHTLDETNSTVFSNPTTTNFARAQQIAGDVTTLRLFLGFNDFSTPAETLNLTRQQLSADTGFNTPVVKVTYEYQPTKILITNNTKVKLQTQPDIFDGDVLIPGSPIKARLV